MSRAPLLLSLSLPLPLLAGPLLSGCTGNTCVGGACLDDSGAAGDDGGTDDGGTDTGGGPTTDQPDERDCTVTVSHRPEGPATIVQVAGEFNGWEPQDMEDPDADGTWTLALDGVPAGEHAYKFLVNGDWETELPVDVETKWLDGVENRNLRVGDCTVPALSVEEAWATGDGELYARVQLARAEGGADIDPDSVVVTVGGDPVDFTFDAASGEVEVSLSALVPGKHTVRVWAADQAGNRAEDEPIFVPLWVESEPFSWEDGLIYFVFTDRFSSGESGGGTDDGGGSTDGVAWTADYQGGDFQGVTDAIEAGYFDALGVNTLWLSPVTNNPDGGYLGTDGYNLYTGYHGYWPTSPLTIEDRWGGGAALQELVDAAHARGIRVMFDLVLNHVHEDHVYIDEHPDWFGDGCVCGTDGCGWDEMARTCWFTDYLPDLDYRNHDITEQVLADTLELLETYDVDAVRVDAAKHMDHVVMRSLRKRLDTELTHGDGPEWYAVGETFTTDRGLLMAYVGDHELHGQFDFPMMYAVRTAFVSDGSFRDLEASVEEGAATYGDAAWAMSPFLGNHDVSRFATEVTGAVGDPWAGWLDDPMAEGGDEITQWDLINRMSMALAFTLTQPGVPLLYYGDEIGLHGGGDPDNRRFMAFEPDLSANRQELLDRTRVIGAARSQSPALRRGDRRQLWVDDTLLVYSLETAEDVAIVAMNKGDSTRSESVPLQEILPDGSTLVDLKVDGRTFGTSGGALQLELGSWDWAILRTSWD